MTDATATTPAAVARHYDHLRRTVGVYAPAAGLVSLTGLERGLVLSRLLARESEYVEPNTARDSLVLDADGGVWDAVVHIELDDTGWLLSQSRADLADLVRAVAADLDEAEVADAAAEYEAVAFEGPKAWRIAAQLVDFEVSSLVLHGAAVVAPAGGGSGGNGGNGVLARIGSTGEFGYVLLAPVASGSAAWVLEQAEALGGGAVGAEALARVRAEARHPQVPVYSEGLTVREAGLEWLVSWNREDDFRGAAALSADPEPERGLIHLTAPAGTAPAAGTALYAGEVAVGAVREVFATVDAADDLALGLLDKPFDVPGLTLRGTGPDGAAVKLRTVSAPVVVPLSWSERIGA
ncbi:glycine cleavage system aminomethyltransferase T [Catenulispora sp. GP43]|uniref:hypothetical protein n=1 Tax=Catenulispora sp. GP43 TaxID=3156263 RepID=UPI003515B61C